MPWQCAACTFENTNDEFLSCSVCETPRTVAPEVSVGGAARAEDDGWSQVGASSLKSATPRLYQPVPRASSAWAAKLGASDAFRAETITRKTKGEYKEDAPPAASSRRKDAARRDARRGAAAATTKTTRALRRRGRPPQRSMASRGSSGSPRPARPRDRGAGRARMRRRQRAQSLFGGRERRAQGKREPTERGGRAPRR